MEHTLVAVFDSEIHARNALDELAASGCSRNDMHINAARQSGMTGSTSIPGDEQSIGEKIRSFFSNLFSGGDDTTHADVYSEAVKLGRYVLTVTARDDDAVIRETEVLNRHNPIELEEQLPSGTGAVQRGSVRVFPRTSESASAGSTQLRNDQLEAERDSMDQLATDDSDFRTHWQSSYAQSGGRYEDYAPAYMYGSALGTEERYRGRQWDEIEPLARTDWEATHADRPWEKTKEAVRAGWEKVASKLA
jgi:hypothetical protein